MICLSIFCFIDDTAMERVENVLFYLCYVIKQWLIVVSCPSLMERCPTDTVLHIALLQPTPVMLAMI